MDSTASSPPAVALPADSMSTCLSSTSEASSCAAASFAAATPTDIAPSLSAALFVPSASASDGSSSLPARVASAPSARASGAPAALSLHSSGASLPARDMTSTSSHGDTACAFRVAAGRAAPARRPVSIAVYSSEALPLLLPLTAQTSSPSRLKFRKQLLRRLGLLLPSYHASEQQRRQQNKQRPSLSLPQQQRQKQPQDHPQESLEALETRQQLEPLETRQQQAQQEQTEMGAVEAAKKSARCPAFVQHLRRGEGHGRRGGRTRCWVYLHRAETPGELQYMCGQLLDAFRICYMTDQDLYFADAVVQQQERKRSRRWRRSCNTTANAGNKTPSCLLDCSSNSSCPSTAPAPLHTAEESAAATAGAAAGAARAAGAQRAVRTVGEESEAMSFEEGVYAGNLHGTAAHLPTVVAASARTSAASDIGQRDSTCACCCCICCRCGISSEDEEELFEEWGRLAHCESPSNIRRALFELKLQIRAAAAAAAGSAAPVSAPSASTASTTADVATATVATCPVANAAATASASAAVGAATAFGATPLVAALRGQHVQQQKKQQTVLHVDDWPENSSGPLAREKFIDKEEEEYSAAENRAELQHRMGSKTTRGETSGQTEDTGELAEGGGTLQETTLSCLVAPYLLHLQHLINRFCAPANRQGHIRGGSSNRTTVQLEKSAAAAGGKSDTERYRAERKEQQPKQQRNPQPEEEQQQQEEEQQPGLIHEAMEEGEEEEVDLSRRCHAEAKKLGVYMHPAVQLKKSRGAAGRGLFAGKHIAAGSVLFRIPHSAMINVYTALQDPVFAPLAEWLLTLRPDGETEVHRQQQHQSDQRMEEEEEEEEGRGGKKADLERKPEEQQQNPNQRGQLKQHQQREVPTKKNTRTADKAPVAAAARAGEGGTATSATESECAAACKAASARASLSTLKEEGRPLVDSDTLCLLYFLFEAHRAAAALSSQSRKTSDEGFPVSTVSRQHARQHQQQEQQEQQLEKQQRQLEQEQQQVRKHEEKSEKRSKFSFFFELLPPRHEEQQQPLIAGPPEVPELLQDEPLSRAIDSTLLRSFELYRRLLPLLQDAFAEDEEGQMCHEEQQQQRKEHYWQRLGKKGQHQQQQQQKEEEEQQLRKCRQEKRDEQQQRHNSVREKEEACKVRRVSSGDGSTTEAEPAETAPETAAAAPVTSTTAWATRDAARSAAERAPAATAEEGRRELKEWIDSLTLEQFIWGQCHMGSRAFALELPPPAGDASWKQVAVQQHDYSVEEGDEGEDARTTAAAGKVEEAAAAAKGGEAAPAVEDTHTVPRGLPEKEAPAGEEETTAEETAAASAVAREPAAREQEEAAGRAVHGGGKAAATGSAAAATQLLNVQVDAAARAGAASAEAFVQAEGQQRLLEEGTGGQQEDEDEKEADEEEDVVAFLPVLRDRPPRERPLYYRHADAAAAVPSASSAHPSSLAAVSVSCSSMNGAAGPHPASVANTANAHADSSASQVTAVRPAAGPASGDAGGFVLADNEYGGRASFRTESEERAATRDEGRTEKEKTEGRQGGVGEIEQRIACDSRSQGFPATAGAARGGTRVLHVPDHPTTFLPFVDLANHHVHAQCCFPFFDAATATATVVAHADIPAAAEIYLFYGPLQSWELLAQFGFTTESFFALEKRRGNRKQQPQKAEQQSQLQEQPRKQQQLQQQTEVQQQPWQGADWIAARREDGCEERRDTAAGECGSDGEDVFLTGLPAKEHRYDCCGAWSFTKEKRGNPYDTLTLCFEPMEEEEEEGERVACPSNSTTSTRQLLSRLFDISAESLLRTGAPHFSPRLLDSLQVSLHPDVDQLLRMLLRKKKEQQQLLCGAGCFDRGSSRRASRSFCSSNSSNMRQQKEREPRSLDGDCEPESEEEGGEAIKKEEMLTLCKAPVVQTVDELLRSCVGALKQLEYWKEHEEERPHWYDAWSSRAASHLGNQRVLFQKIKTLFGSSSTISL